MASADPGSVAAVEDLFPGLVAYLVGRFGASAARVSAAPLVGGGEIKKGGYGVPYLLSWTLADGRTERLVLETVGAGGFGHEERADRAAVVLRAADDAGKIPLAGDVVGCGVLRAGLPIDEGAPPAAAPDAALRTAAADLSGTGEPFFLMRFVEGVPYAADLARIAAAGALTPLDEARVLALADYLAELHRAPVSHPTWYRRRLRDLTGSGECVAGVVDSYPTPSGFLTSDLLQQVEGLCLEWRYRLRDRQERLRAVHGDFHPWNILFQEGLAFRLLDHSRGAFGDPADDVSALLVNYVFFALRTRGTFEGPFASLFSSFWKRYLAQSGDAALPEVIAPHFAFRSLVVASPIWYPNESERTRRLLFRFLLSVLESPAFEPERIPSYLEREDP